MEDYGGKAAYDPRMTEARQMQNRLSPNAGGGAVGAGIQSAPTPISPLQGRIMEQHDALRQLHMTIDQLEGRLYPILSLNPPEATNATKDPEPNQLVEHLQRHNYLLVIAIQRLSDITGRLHI